MMERDSLLAALEWQLAAGVDETVGFEPADRFAPPPAPALSAAPPPPSVRPAAPEAAVRRRAAPPPAAAPSPASGPSPIAGSSPAAAHDPAGAADLDALRDRLLAFDGCPLRKTATNTVFGEGPAGARLMIVGEAPGADEDRQGRPFVGPSGRLLERMLAAIGLAREEVYIANTIYWRPPGNRTPSAEEVEVCRPFIRRQIALVGPEVLMPVGGAAAKTLLGAAEGIMRLRGRWHGFDAPDGAIDVMPTFHPAFLLRAPARKREAWRDLLAVKARLESGRR